MHEDWGTAVRSIAEAIIDLRPVASHRWEYLSIVESLGFILTEYGTTDDETDLYGELRIIEAELLEE